MSILLLLAFTLSLVAGIVKKSILAALGTFFLTIIIGLLVIVLGFVAIFNA